MPGDYQTSDETDIHAYNSQELEIDAWAWATVAVVQNVGEIPDFTNALGTELHDEILKRAETLIK